MSDSSASALMPAANLPALDLPTADPTAAPNPDPVRSLPPKAACIWCGAPVRYESEAQAREHWGYCNLECREDFLGELGCDPEVAFNRSRRKLRRKAPPAFLQRLTDGAKAHAANFDAAASTDPSVEVDELDDLEEPA